MLRVAVLFLIKNEQLSELTRENLAELPGLAERYWFRAEIGNLGSIRVLWLRRACEPQETIEKTW